MCVRRHAQRGSLEHIYPFFDVVYVLCAFSHCVSSLVAPRGLLAPTDFPWCLRKIQGTSSGQQHRVSHQPVWWNQSTTRVCVCVCVSVFVCACVRACVSVCLCFLFPFQSLCLCCFMSYLNWCCFTSFYLFYWLSPSHMCSLLYSYLIETLTCWLQTLPAIFIVSLSSVSSQSWCHPATQQMGLCDSEVMAVLRIHIHPTVQPSNAVKIDWALAPAKGWSW